MLARIGKLAHVTWVSHDEGLIRNGLPTELSITTRDSLLEEYLVLEWLILELLLLLDEELLIELRILHHLLLLHCNILLGLHSSHLFHLLLPELKFILFIDKLE
jgi:hypothetical protein